MIMFNSLDINTASDTDSSLQSNFHQNEAHALLNGEIREASFNGDCVAFDKTFSSRYAH